MSKKKKILVVEDEVIIADDLCHTISKLGYEALPPVLSYQEALSALEKYMIDLVILDIQLKGNKTGLDIAKHIRNTTKIPFIYLSSFSDVRTLELAKTTMPYAYLVKPFRMADVFTAIEIALNNHKQNVTIEPTTHSSIPDFTPTEKIVLRLISENMSTKQIAEKLFVSTSTVKNHRHNISRKLELPANTHSLTSWVLNNKSLLKF